MHFVLVLVFFLGFLPPWCVSDLAELVVAVAARSGDTANKFADKLGIPKSYEGYEKLANDPEIDIIYIGTITALHKDHALMCIWGTL